MAQTIYASFSDASLAEKAAGALLDYGVRQEDLSLVTSGNYGRERITEARSVDPNAVDRNFRGDWDADESGYRGGVAAPERPVVANPGTPYAGGPGVGAVYTPPVYDETVVEEDVIDRDDLDTEDRKTESAAKHGISTTTAGDAESGALKGAGWGLGLGILGIIASLAVPGVGWVVGGGALATAIGGAIGTTVGGAIAGGVAGYLKDQGVPDVAAANYSKDVENGGALLAVNVPSNNVDAGTAEQILGKYGAMNVSSY
jgi:hypothetical protein